MKMTEDRATLTYETDESKVVMEHKVDITIGEFYEMCEKMALAIGYHPKNVQETFKIK